MAELNSYLEQLNQRLIAQDGKFISNYISLPFKRKYIPDIIISQFQQRGASIGNLIRSKVSSPFPALIESILASHANFEIDSESAFHSHEEAFRFCQDYFGDKESPTLWFYPVFARVCDDLRLLSFEIERKTGNDKFMRDVAKNLTEAWKLCFDKSSIDSPNSKRKAILAFTNISFKLYFRMKFFKHCENLIKSLDSRKTLSEFGDRFPVSEKVTYHYYQGRLKMFDELLEDARTDFLYCLNQTPISEITNRRRILLYLVPVQMALGVMPSSLICTQYGLTEYWELSQAIRTGNIPRFDSIFEAHQVSFVRCGVFLLLEQTRFLAYRNLFKIIHKLIELHNVPLGMLNEIVNQAGLTMDLDELECILCNLISKGHIRGYLIHGKFLVLSKKIPFPPMTKSSL